MMALRGGGELESNGRSATSTTAKEWALQEVAKSPMWSAEKWQKVGEILGYEFVGDCHNDTETSA